MLGPCPSCRRHVRVAERTCPFCSAAVSVSASPGLTKRLSRAAIIAASTMAIAGCPKTKEPETIVQPYGAPPRPDDGGPIDPDAGADETGAIGPGPGAPVALYGAAPPPNQ
jgi:hypothetical protein